MKIDDKEFEKAFSEEEETPSRRIASSDTIRIKLNKSVITSTVFDWLGSLFIALISVLIVMSFFVRVIDVDGTSMEPTLINSDKVLITDLFYTPHQGDIVVISHGAKYSNALIKRVIATEGQTISFKDAVAVVNGKPLDFDYLIADYTVYTGAKPYEGEYTIEENLVLVDGKPFTQDHTIIDGVVYVNGAEYEGEYTIAANAVLVNGKPLDQDYIIVDGIVYVDAVKYEGEYTIVENAVFVDGVLLNEDYIAGVTLPGERPIEETIPAGYVYVMGDNRSYSLDSRSEDVGLIKVTDIIGKAQLVVIPHTRDSQAQVTLDFSKIRYLYD